MNTDLMLGMMPRDLFACPAIPPESLVLMIT